MRQTSKAKVARLLVSSLMSSDLTNKEIMDLCQALIDGDLFIKELGYDLQRLVGNTMLTQSKNDDDAEYILMLLKNNNISRDYFIMIVDELFMGLGEYLKSKKLSLRSIVEIVKEHVSNSDWSRLVDRLHNDEYLNHIMERDKF